MRTLEARRVLSVDVAGGQQFTIAENSAANTVVGTVQTTPPADPSQPLTFSIIDGNPSNAFLIAPNSGEIRVNNSAALDFETTPEWQLTIGVQVNGEPTPGQSAVVSIHLTDVNAPATVTLAGGTATLSLIGGHVNVQQGTTTLYDAPVEDVSSLNVVGSSSADRLIVDFAGGNPIPVGGLSYDGLDPTSGSGDSLELHGGTFDSIDYRFDNGHDGRISLVQGGVTSTIDYFHLEPIVNTGTAAEMTFTFGASNDHVVLEDVGSGMLRLRSTDAVPTFETTAFAAPATSLKLLTGDGDDEITVTPLTGSFALSIDGQGGANKLIVDQVDSTASLSSQFQFAGFSFDQSDTPDQATVLSSGTLAGGYGAVINVGPDAATGSVAFPDDPTGFDSSLSVGRLIYPSLTTGTLALNMPAGNVGTSLRAGIELSWSGGRTLSNQDGDDFVIYESSSNSNAPDAAMVQVHIAGGDWTQWRYETKDSRGVYSGAAPQGAFATAFDLTDFGLTDGQSIDAIRFANMTAADRMAGPGVEKVPGSGVLTATGFVLPGDNGATSNVLPDPGASASFAYFGNSTFDPDPLYFGMLHPLAASAVTGGIDQIRIDDTTVAINRDGTTRPTIDYASIATLNVNTHDAADDVRLVLGGAGLPGNVSIDGGNPSVGDKLTIEGTTGTHTLDLANDTITTEASTITVANLESLTIDVTAGTATTGDAISLNRSFTLSGTSPSLQIQGGAGQLDSLTVDTEYAPVSATGPTFSFAGVSFDQASTPDLFSELGTGALSGGLGVVVTTRPGAISPVTSGFPDSTSGYDASLSLGNLWARQTSGTTNYVSLPNTTNDGTTARGGFALSWSSDRVLVDDAGDDLVIYEAGTTNSPEPVMVQVHDVTTNTWSSWIYKPAVSQAVTTGSPNVGFATTYDLDADFHMAGAVIDAIRVVNMIASDRMQDSSGVGIVLPGETNPTSTTLPKPGTQASFANYGSGDFDPDPIYFGVRHALGGVAARNDVVSITPNSVAIDGYMSIGYAGFDSLTVNTGLGSDSITVAPSTTTTYAVDGGSPTIDAANPGDRVVLDLTGAGSALMTVTGIGEATLTSSFRDVTFAGIDSFGANSAFDVKVTAAANQASGTDTFNVVRTAAADEISVNGQRVFRADRAAIDNLLIEGSDDDDRLTLDFAAGDPIPTGFVTFAAGIGSNELTFNGTGITSITHRFDNTTDGRTTIDGSIVDYKGVAQIFDNLAAANRTLDFTADGNDIVLADDASTAGRSQATSNHGPTLEFANPTSSLTVNAGPQNDSITLETLDTAFAASVTLSGQAGDDYILLDSNGPTAGGTVDWITFPLTVDGGGQSGDRLTIEDSSSTRDKTYSVSNVQIGGGVIPPGAAVATPAGPPTVDGTIDPGEWDEVPTAYDSGARPAVDQQSILHFNFSEGSGTTTADTTGNGNNGLLVTPNGPQFRLTAGQFGGALEFNGTTDYAWFQDAQFNVGTQGSLSFWVNMDDVSRRNEFFEGPGNVGLEFQYRENGSGATKGQFYGTPNHALVGNTDDFAIQSGGAAASAGTWVNLQFTWQKTGASSGEMHLYVNGAEVSYLAGNDATITNWSTVASTANAMMTMGRDASTTPGAANTRYFDGKIDDVAWFDVVLTATQRAAIYQTGPTPVIHSIDQIQATVGHDQVFDAKAVNSANGHLIAYWNMDDAPGTSVAAGDGGTTIRLHTTPEGTEAQFQTSGGKFGGALDFTNPNSYATFQDPSFDISSQGSLSVWLYLRDGVRRNELFEGPGDGGFEFQYRNNSNGQFYGYVDRATGNTDDPAIQASNAANNVGAWHNVIYTWQRTSATAGELRIYIDGTEVSYSSNNQNITGWNNLVSTVNGLFRMGADQGAATPDRWLDGKLDDVAWFNQVLTSTQRAALQTQSVDQIQAAVGHDPFFDAKAVNAANGHLLAYWNFDNPVGTTVVAGNGGTQITLNLNVPAGAEGVAFDTVNGPTPSGTGTQLNAGDFDGNLDFIRVTDGTSLDFDKTRGTISFWINPDAHAVDNNATTGFSNLVEDSNEQIEVGISWQQDAGATFGNADFYRRIVFSPFENTASGNQNIVVSNTRLTFGQWTHVTVTWDYSTHSAAIYINGALDSTLINNTSNASIWTQAAGNTGDWIFGADGKAASKFFAGEMADIAVFGTALRPGEVQSAYQNGVGNTGGFDLSGAAGKFTWDSTTLYGLIEDYPAGTANSNGPFSNLFVDLYYNGTLVTSLDASQPSNNVAGSVVASGDGGARYEFSIPFAAVSPTFNPANGDSLTYKIRAIDADAANAGFDTQDTTLGWVVEPPDAGNGLRKLDFAKSENFFGVGGRLTYANFAEFTLNAGNGVDTITIVDSNLATPVTNPTQKFTINAGGGNDDITIASIDSAFQAAVTIDGQAGNDDHVAINAALTLGSAVSTGNLLVTAERIDVTAAIDTTAGTVGDVTFHADTKLTMSSAADVTAGGDFLADGDSGTIETAADVTTSGGKITYGAATKLTGDVKLTSGNGDVAFSGTTTTLDGGYLLTVSAGTGDVAFDGAVGATPLSGLKITANSLTVAATLAVDLKGIDVDVDDTAEFDDAVTTTGGGDMTVTNGGVLTIADAANLSISGDFLQDGAGRSDLFADITTTGGKITFQGPLRLKDDVKFTTAGGDVEFDGPNATVDGDSPTPGNFALTIVAGAGNVTFDQTVGGLSVVGGIRITSAGNVDFNDELHLSNSGLDVTATGAVDFAAIVDTILGGGVKIDNGGLLTIVDAADFTLDGSFQQTGTGATSLAGDIQTTDDKISFNGAVTLAPNAAGKQILKTGTTGADVTFHSTLNGTTAGSEDLEVDAGGGNVHFAGIVGGGKALGDVVIDAAKNVDLDDAFTAQTLTHLHGTGTTTFGGTTTLNTSTGTALDVRTTAVIVNAEVKSTGGDLNLAVDDLAIDTTTGKLNATANGIVTIVTDAATRPIDLGSNPSGSLGLSSDELNQITAKVLRIGDADSGSINLSAAIAPTGTPILHLVTGGDVAGTGKITIERLAVEAVGDVKLSNANDVDRLGILVTGAGKQISFRDVDDLLLTDVDGVGGLETVDGDATVDVGGTLKQDVFGSIVVDGLQLLGTGAVDLSNPTNIVNTLAADLTEALTFRDFVDLKVGTVQTFGAATTGITTTADDVSLRSRTSITLEKPIDLGAARVLLVADDGAIDDAGGTTPKVVAAELAMSAATGIGVTQPLVTKVGLLAAENVASGGIAVDDQSHAPLTIGTTNGLSGLLNLGDGGIRVEHVGPMSVVKPINDFGGGITLVTTADGGNDDNLELFAPIKVTGGTGDLVLTAGTDLLLHDTGSTYDVWTTGSGSLFGSAGRNVVIDPNVIVRSATGQIENIPPLLQNVNGPQIANSGAALVNFDYGRLLELNFTATVNWSDGTIDVLPLALPGTTTAFHTYTGNPNATDPAAPIPVVVTLQSDSRIHFDGYEFTAQQILLQYPGDGVKNIRIDTTPHVPHLTFPPSVRLVELPSNNTTTLIRSHVDEGGDSAVEATQTTERIVILREVLPDGREGSAVRFGQNVLNNLAEVFAKLRNGRYRIYLFEPETQALRQVMEIYVRDGKPTSAGAAADSSRDRPDGAVLQAPQTVEESPPDVVVRAEVAPTHQEAHTATAVTTAVAGLVLTGATTDWSKRVDDALAGYRKFSRLRAKRFRRPTRTR